MQHPQRQCATCTSTDRICDVQGNATLNEDPTYKVTPRDFGAIKAEIEKKAAEEAKAAKANA